MKVLVVGQGGREHALCWKLAQSPKVSKVYCAPGNAGTADCAENVRIEATDLPALIEFAKNEQIDLTVPGPEAPLVAGICDAFKDAGLTVFGPSAQAAELEGSKTFAKKLMRLGNIPTAEAYFFDQASTALEFLEEQDDKPWVVKADGLAAGKGVTVCENKEQAMAAVRESLTDRAFGDAGNKILIEEFLEGEEVSILAIVDGRTIITLETSQDHKAAHDGDTGPNTGGMGAYSPAPLVDNQMLDEIVNTILIPTVHTMKREKRAFTGVLYAGLMITKQGPKVLEFNVRLGDPETQPIMMRLQSDLFEVLYAAAKGELRDVPELQWDSRPAVCVVMAAEGYPGAYRKEDPIRGLDASDAATESHVFHAGTTYKNNEVVTNGGRVLGVTALGTDLVNAKMNAYQRVKTIRWEGAWCRKDISDKAREHSSPASE